MSAAVAIVREQHAPLAFDASGDRFEPPEWAAHWKVRRYAKSGRGTPETIYDSQGMPLSISLDAGIDELRDAVEGVAAKYRLDPLDENKQSQYTDDEKKRARFGCVMVRGEDSAASSTGTEPRDFRDSLILDLVRQNQENCERMTAQFSGMMEAAAKLVTAADGAGLPAREPRELSQLAAAMQLATRNDTHDDDDGSNAALVQVLTNLSDQVTPLLSHAVHTKVMGLSAEQSLALMGKPAPAPAAATTSPDSKPSTSAPAGDRLFGKLASVETLLNAAEAAFAKRVIQAMSPDEMAAWREQVLTMTPEQLAQVVRDQMKGRTS